MAFEILHGSSAPFADQARWDSVDLDILFGGFRNRGVIRGCNCTANGSGLGVDVEAGYVQLSSGLAVAVSAATVTPDAADASNPRFDLVVVDSAGSLQVRKGTATALPAYPPFPSLTDGDVALAAVYLDAAVATMTDSRIVDKRVFTWGPIWIEKTSNETLTSDTTLQNDNELLFTMGANETWMVDALVYHTSAWNVDAKFAFTHPTGSTFKWGAIRVATTATSAAGNADSTAINAGASGTVLNVGGSYLSSITVTELNGMAIHGLYEGGANAGDLQFQWAQLASSTNTMTVRRHSTMRLMRLA